jgi:hypothetical protein
VSAGAAAPGARLFARYAYAPNDLGYCGPAQSRALFTAAATAEIDAAVGADSDVRVLARQFSGAWPYLRLLAELSGIADPLDERVVRAYWVGGPLLAEIDQAAFGAALLDVIGPQAGHYWHHLTPDLLAEAMPTHAFHVFGVYPWSRLLTGPAAEHPLRVLDSCRIRWGEVAAVDAEHVVVESLPLTWDGARLDLGPPRRERVRHLVDGAGFVTGPRPGEVLALHWDWVCDRLGTDDVAALERWTRWQLAAANARLARPPA